MLSSLRTKLVLSHVGLMLLAMVVLAFYLMRSINSFYLSTVQGRMQDDLVLISEQIGPMLAVGDKDAVRSYLEKINRASSMRVLVADADGVIVGSTEPEDYSLLGQPGISKGLTKALSGQVEQVIQGGTQPTADLASLVAPINSGGRRVGSVRLSYQLVDLHDQIQHLTDIILVGLGAAAAFGLLVSLALAQSLSAPARQLASAARALSSGDLGYRIKPRGKDEIREAGHAFDALADRLQQLEIGRQQLLGDISHDLHSAVTGVSMAVEALQRGAVEEATTRSVLLDGLASHARRLHRLGDDLLQAARIEAGRLKLRPIELDPRALLRSVAAEFTAEAAQEGVVIDVQVDEQLPIIRADGERLAQALGNLVENAIRYTPPGCKVTIGGEARNGECLLFVRDQGPGLPDQDVSRLFDRFKHYEQERPGRLGFGLAIAKGLVEAHGGRIDVSAVPKEGATFTIILPVEAASPSGTAGA